MKDLDDRAAGVRVARDEAAVDAVVGARGLLLERALLVHLGTEFLHLREGIGGINEVHAERARLAAGAVTEELLAPIDVVLVALMQLALAQVLPVPAERAGHDNVYMTVVVRFGGRVPAHEV